MYRNDLVTINGIVVVSVVLFHMGLLKSGYLNVDAFCVLFELTKRFINRIKRSLLLGNTTIIYV